jgi:hypothetical protein
MVKDCWDCGFGYAECTCTPITKEEMMEKKSKIIEVVENTLSGLEAAGCLTNENYYVKLTRGKVTHNLPRVLSETEFRFIFGCIAGHLIDNLGAKSFNIVVERGADGKADGSYTKK